MCVIGRSREAHLDLLAEVYMQGLVLAWYWNPNCPLRWLFGLEQLFNLVLQHETATFSFLKEIATVLQAPKLSVMGSSKSNEGLQTHT